MIAHAHEECAWLVLFFSDIIYSGHYLESVLSMASAIETVLGNLNCTVVVPSLIGEDCIGGAICVCV